MLSSTPSAPKRGMSNTGPGSASSLRDRLAAVLPQGHKFGIHHISTPPTPTESLCAAPPGQRPDKTYRESHFLAISIRPPDKTAAPVKCAAPGADHAKEPDPRKRALVFAVEVLIFTTAYQTTLFVSKADSTGYLHLLNLPQGAPSPIRQVCATFLAYLLDHRRRNHVQSVVNLFARAQAQYLFPGSAHNKGKHVLNDWGLVRWWCKTLNPLMEGLSKEPWTSTKGYLLVPGLEEMETRAFIPQTMASAANWVVGHPLERTSHYTRDFDWVPPRCLIPGYPDDPKSRFRDELDEEVSKQKQGIEVWKSVRSLEQFWDMMAFRQECSSGRLTGFVWLVFDPNQPPLSSAAAIPPATVLTTPNASFGSSLPPAMPATPPRRRVDVASYTPRSSPLKAPASPTALPPPLSKATKKKAKKKLSGRIVPRAPKIKTHARSYLADRPTATAYYYWPPEGRGDKMVDDAEYKRIAGLLLHLDFSTLDKTAGSSRRWLNEAGMSDAGEGDVVGRAVIPDSLRVNGAVSGAGSGNVINLSGLVRRKNVSLPSGADASRQPDSAAKEPAGLTAEPTTKVNVLGASLVRKRKKEVGDR
ncbi:histone acetylation protein-domain-containing protein [Parachaetomium inaequale]|uniref:histone acetyltransferase n=1 Tax=Parachaetomium inaequale TaxID=2588326 RepID=A0AAN6SKH5_9PEZI|nr:histone acetylation protein-domain-containing protein [Parachaetomium inaequale]